MENEEVVEYGIYQPSFSKVQYSYLYNVDLVWYTAENLANMEGEDAYHYLSIRKSAVNLVD